MMTSFLALVTTVLLGAGDPVTSLSVLPNVQRTEVLVEVGGRVEHRAFQMEGPNRIVLDLMNAEHALPQNDFPAINRGGIREIRTRQYSEDVVRVEIILEDKAAYAVENHGNVVRVSIETGTPAFEPWETVAVGPDAMSVQDRMTALAEGPSSQSSIDAPAPQQVVPRITVSFDRTSIEEVLFTFSDYSGKSIVPGQSVTGLFVTADIKDQAWDDALEAILIGQGLIATEMQNGIIRVDNISDLNTREETEPLLTRPYRINFGTADEMALVIQPILTPERGGVVAAPNTNTVIVTDIARVHENVAGLIRSLDIATPQVQISAKIIFVNRTDLNELGVTYELKDSQGNQVNVVSPGLADLDNDGALEQIDIGTNVVTLGGNSISAVGNATNRVGSATLSLLSSLVVGRHTLVSFIDALESTNLSEVQARPSVMVADNQQAFIQVGEDTPIRVLDAGTAGAGDGGLPTAAVETRQTGIILETTPHITAGDHILLDVRAERSAVELAESDVGQIFRTQNARTRVLVRDGETVVIGGLTITEVQESRSGIPVLMDLPVLGGLFRTTRQSEVQQDLMILVTPNIVRTGLSN